MSLANVSLNSSYKRRLFFFQTKEEEIFFMDLCDAFFQWLTKERYHLSLRILWMEISWKMFFFTRCYSWSSLTLSNVAGWSEHAQYKELDFAFYVERKYRFKKLCLRFDWKFHFMDGHYVTTWVMVLKEKILKVKKYYENLLEWKKKKFWGENMKNFLRIFLKLLRQWKTFFFS